MAECQLAVKLRVVESAVRPGLGDDAVNGREAAFIRTGAAQYEEERPAYKFTPAGSQGYPLIAYAAKQFYVMANNGLTCLTTACTRPALNNDSGALWDPATRTARLTGQLVNTGGKPAEVFIHWGNRDGGTDPAQWANSITMGAKQPGDFRTQTPPLERNAVYYYRCSATNALGRRWAAETLRFATPAPMNLNNDTALALHWTLDEIAGGKLADATLNGAAATLQMSRSTAIVPGIIGKSLRFAGNDGLTSPILQPPLRHDFAVAFWVRFADNYTTGRYFLRLQPAQLHLGFKDLRPVFNGVTATNPLQPNRWHHLTLTRTGGQHLLYLDGAPASERSAGPDDPYDQLLLRFAGEGQLDGLRVYRRALTPDEIRHLAAQPGNTGAASSRPGT